MNRHDFLAELHSLLDPQVYFEIGVQWGASLRLATNALVAVGVDPNPLVTAAHNQVIYSMASDDYFAEDFAAYRTAGLVDFAFIDGDHHYEQAVRDFYNTQRTCHPEAVIAFDDMLPYSQEVGGRDMVPGHWAGDVWRVAPVIQANQPRLTLVYVDVDPTGLLLVWDLDPTFDPSPLTLSDTAEVVPDYVIKRSYALEPEAALALVASRGA